MSDAVQQIKDRLSIIDVVSPYVELHRAGKNFKGKSPFTNEKTPSFYVSPERGMYYCFSTSQGGDMFTFVQTMEGVDFKGALKILAEKARVELVPVSPEKQTERDRLYALLEAAAAFYVEELKKNPTALAYLKERGVLADTIASWRIGYAPGPPGAGWRTTKEYLMKRGFTDRELQNAGISKRTQDGKEPYDVFRNRIMFPLFDQGGRVVAFSGRTLESGPDIPKYVNSPETELFKKSELLYGYDRAKHGIRHLDFSLIVEGQFDVVMSHQAGYTNTVAVSGTAFTLEHVKLLERLSTKVVLALDADKAGIAAAKRAADVMLRRGLDVKVAMLPEGKDPADGVRDDIKGFKRCIGSSVHVIEFLMNRLLLAPLDARTRKLRAREEVIPYIPLLPNKIDQDHFEAVVAELLGTTKDAVHYEVERVREQESTSVRPSVTAGSAGGVNSEVSVLEDVMTQKLSLLTYIVGVLPLIPKEAHARVNTAVLESTGLTAESLEAMVSLPERAAVLFRAETQNESQPKLLLETELIHALNRLRQLVAREELRAARALLEQAELADDEVRFNELMARITECQKKLQAEPYTLSFLQ
jgi:DNA primase